MRIGRILHANAQLTAHPAQLAIINNRASDSDWDPLTRRSADPTSTPFSQ